LLWTAEFSLIFSKNYHSDALQRSRRGGSGRATTFQPVVAFLNIFFFWPKEGYLIPRETGANQTETWDSFTH
jgi:hypothetical protein